MIAQATLVAAKKRPPIASLSKQLHIAIFMPKRCYLVQCKPLAWSRVSSKLNDWYPMRRPMPLASMQKSQKLFVSGSLDMQVDLSGLAPWLLERQETPRLAMTF